MKRHLEAAEDHIPLPDSTDEESSDLSEDEHKIEDPFLSDEDSDDAPEVFSFKSAHENLLFQNKKTREVIKTHEDEKRKKRKELQEQNLIQKEKKRQKIEDKMLPEDVLENLNDEPNLEIDLLNEDNATSDQDNDNEEIISCSESEEIIQDHGPTLFKCKAFAEEDKKPKSVPENVLSFKDQLLYGGRIRREKSSKEAASKKAKQLVHTQQKIVR